MKILKTAAGCIVFSALLVGGCLMLYNDGSDTENSAIAYAEEYGEHNCIPLQNSITELPITELSGGKLPKSTSISFTFLGDCILSSNAGDTRKDTFLEYAQEKPPTYFFEKALPYYNDSDFVIANSEFVLSDRSLSKSYKEGTAFWFKSPESTADILKSAEIDVVSIANNHTEDYGSSGYEDTKNTLTSAGIKWGDIYNPVYLKKDGITFGIICTKMFNTNYEPIIDPVVQEVKENSDIQILFFHGGTENEHKPEEWLTEMCHRYADMGVDLIVGSHPHVLRPMENYNGTDIIYSLGNFCYGGNRTPENRTVILTETFIFDEDGKYISQEESFTPFYVYEGNQNNWQPSPITNPTESSKALAFMYGASPLPY